MFGRLIAASWVLLLAACGGAPDPPRVAVADVVVTVPAVPSAPGAAYFTLRSNNDKTRLVSVSSPSARRIELHQTREENGVSRMVPLEPAQLSLSAREPLEFAPGGNHAMLFDVDPNLRPGGQISLTFTFDGSPPVTINARLVAPGTSHSGH